MADPSAIPVSGRGNGKSVLMKKLLRGWAAPLGVGCAVFVTSLSAVAAIPDKDCLECHSDKGLTKTNAAGQVVVLFVDAAKFAASAHATNGCASCHVDLKTTHPDDNAAAQRVSCVTCHQKQSETYQASAHGLALRAGKDGAATCADCHSTHEVLPPTSPSSPLHRSRLLTTCGECHPAAAKDLQESVHGKGVAKGEREAPTCTDCHSEHRIEGLKSTTSLKISTEVCSRCHASERMNTKYRLPADRVKTFFESYHGLAAQYGSTLAANCASCHGVHKILPSTDPQSMIHRSHLVETCGKCHPGATENFAFSKVHLDTVSTSDTGTVVNRWVRRVYLGLIVVVIGLLGTHNLLLWLKKALATYRAKDRSITRMSFSQRWQHLTLVISFVALAVTGFALKFPDSWISWMLGANEPFRRWSHRIAGVVLLVAGAYHLVYVLTTREGRQLLKDMLPEKKDLTDLKTNTLYLTGRNGAKARFGRFGYVEKCEYWAVVWGTVIMGVTGLMIWLKIDVTRFLPRWAVDVCVTIHYYEAILACLAIVVWHFYHVLFDPDVYPINWAWWDGKVSAHWQEEEHPLEVQARKGGSPEEKPGIVAQDRPGRGKTG